MVHLYTKPISDHTGIETFVFQMFKEGENVWLPRGKALCLTDMQVGDEENNEDTEAKQEEIRKKMKMWNKKIKTLENLMEKVMETATKKGSHP